MGAGMEKADAAGQSLPRFGVDQLDIPLTQTLHLLGEVGRCEANMVQAFAPVLQETSDTAVRRQRLDQLESSIVQIEQGRSHALVRQRGDCGDREAEAIVIERHCPLEVADDDCDMVDSLHGRGTPCRPQLLLADVDHEGRCFFEVRLHLSAGRLANVALGEGGKHVPQPGIPLAFADAEG